MVASVFSVLFSQGRCFFSFVWVFRSQHDVSNLGLTLICLQAASQIAKAGSKVDLQVRLKPHGGALLCSLH